MVELSFIDSNIIIFSNVKNSPEYQYALNIVEEGLKGRLHLCFNTIIALESHYKLAKLTNIEEANYRVGNLFKSKRILYFNVSKETIRSGFSIAKNYNLRTNDAVIVSSMLENNVTRIYTDNEKDFKKITDFEIINPIKR
jgi:predicted nucleic acid-binding protein